MTKPCLFLQALPGQSSFPWLDSCLADQVDVLDQYGLSSTSLESRIVLILTMHQDQRWLHHNRGLLEHFVKSGGTLIIQGHIAIRFLGVLEQFVPLARPQLSQFKITFCRPQHPVFAGLTPQTLNLRRGVAGFYARGSNPPPKNAEIITAMSDGTLPVDWMVRLGAGLVFAHSGNDLWTTFDDRLSNVDFARRLVEWAVKGGIEA